MLLFCNIRNYMNDSFRTNVFVRYSPETIACACIYLAARKLQFCLPNNPPWFVLFDAREDDLKDISLDILRLYTRKKVWLTFVTNRSLCAVKQSKKKTSSLQFANALSMNYRLFLVFAAEHR